VKEKLSSLGFESTNIERAKDKLLEHGLIVRNFHQNDGLYFNITERGKFALRSIFNIDILHTSSYSVKFPKEFMESKMVKPYKNNLSDYASCFVRNVISLLKLLMMSKDMLNKEGQKSINELLFELLRERKEENPKSELFTNFIIDGLEKVIKSNEKLYEVIEDAKNKFLVYCENHNQEKVVLDKELLKIKQKLSEEEWEIIMSKIK
jgi:DNA-binding MarR family transcriptional regulator